MKKISFLAIAFLIASTLFAQQAEFKFEREEYDFGQFDEGGGPVTTVFTFTNSGSAPLILSNVQASCGCTSPSWTQQPVEPGQQGEITVTYNPKGRPGRFSKTITIQSNAQTNPYRLYIKGYVLPAIAGMTDVYNKENKIGSLSIKNSGIDFGTIKKSDAPVLQQIEYANHSKHDIDLELRVAADNSSYLSLSTTQSKVLRQQVGTMNITIDPKKCKLWGPVETDFLVVVDGDASQTDKNKMKVKFELIDDFANLTPQQRMESPIIEIASSIDLGVVAANAKIKKGLTVKNIGVNPLEVRRVVNDNNALSFTLPKKAIASGKHSDITIECTGKEVGKYSKILTIYTNDPENQKVNVTVTWEVK